MNTYEAGVKFAWHVHHDVLVEPLVESYETRVAYIVASKPPREQTLRLRLFRRVRGPLPAALVQTGKIYAKAQEPYSVGYVEAKEGYDRTTMSCQDQILALHATECPKCPWDGRTIFSED